MDPAAPIATIDGLHACLAVANLEASVDWYRRVLGFEVLQQRDFPELAARIVFLASRGAELELVEREPFTPFRRPDPPTNHLQTQGISQLSFRVHHIEAILEEVRRRSIPVVLDLVDAKPLKLKAFFIRDNDGNLIEFIERY
jgi:catechol 2,3-dioxygenase-like lactoylglutathione lyase family enzyme